MLTLFIADFSLGIQLCDGSQLVSIYIDGQITLIISLYHFESCLCSLYLQLKKNNEDVQLLLNGFNISSLIYNLRMLLHFFIFLSHFNAIN